MATDTVGSKDGATAADNDMPYVFGQHSTMASIESMFTTRQTARLLILRGRVRADSPTSPACAHNHVQLDADAIGFECLDCAATVSD